MIAFAMWRACPSRSSHRPLLLKSLSRLIALCRFYTDFPTGTSLASQMVQLSQALTVRQATEVTTGSCRKWARLPQRLKGRWFLRHLPQQIVPTNLKSRLSPHSLSSQPNLAVRAINSTSPTTRIASPAVPRRAHSPERTHATRSACHAVAIASTYPIRPGTCHPMGATFTMMAQASPAARPSIS